jgi:predicted GIY-YIG superfamily endonuclease
VHYVYVLRSVKDGNLYTGYTTELRRRVSDHAAG